MSKIEYNTVKGFRVLVIGDFVWDPETDEMIGEVLDNDMTIRYFDGGSDALLYPDDRKEFE